MDSLVERAVEPAEALRSVRAAVRVPQNVVERAGQVARTVLDLAHSAPSAPWNVPVTPHRRFEPARVDLDRAKALRRAAAARGGDLEGTTLNDVVLAACAGAMRAYLQERGEEPPEGLVYRAMVPVSVRDVSEQMALGNRVSMMVADLPVGDPDALERLRFVHAHMASRKEMGEAVGANTLMEVTGYAPPTLLALGSRLAVRAMPMNTVITNIPGPQFPLYCLGSRMLEAFPYVCVVDGMAMIIAVISYDGKLAFGLSGDRSAVSDLHVLAESVETAFVELEAALGLDTGGEAAARPAPSRSTTTTEAAEPEARGPRPRRSPRPSPRPSEAQGGRPSAKAKSAKREARQGAVRIGLDVGDDTRAASRPEPLAPWEPSPGPGPRPGGLRPTRWPTRCARGAARPGRPSTGPWPPSTPTTASAPSSSSTPTAPGPRPTPSTPRWPGARTRGPSPGCPSGSRTWRTAPGSRPATGPSCTATVPRARSDSVQVARMRAAGAVPVGKTAAPEFGTLSWTRTRAWGTTRNPWDPSRTPGGSSGGSAAAVAAGLVPLATASDGGGSTRSPAGFCGLVGHKASFGRVPDPRAAGSMTAVSGALVTTVADAARHLDVVAGPDAAGPHLPARSRPVLRGGRRVARHRGPAGPVVGGPGLRRRRPRGGRGGPGRGRGPGRGGRPRPRRRTRSASPIRSGPGCRRERSTSG